MLHILPSSFVILLILLTEEADSVTSEDAAYLGCYSTDFVESNPYYKVKQQLLFDQGINVCIDRLTMYVGVQEDIGWPDENLIFCGNELLNHSMKVDDKRCKSCSGKKQRQCGRQGSMALYRLRDTTPLAVYISTERSGIKMFLKGNHATTVKVPFSSYVRTADYLYAEDEVYFVYDTSLYRCFYNYTLSTYGDCKNTVYMGSPSSVLGIAIDWTELRVYWDYYYNENIYQSGLAGDNQITLLHQNSEEFGLKLDPYERVLFFQAYFQQFKTLVSYALTSKRLEGHLKFGTKGVFDIKPMLALDLDEQSIYFIAKVGASYLYHLMKVDYEGNFVRAIYEGDKISDARGLDVFNGEVVWVNYAGRQYTVYSCKLTPKCEAYDLKIIDQTSEKLLDVKIYHPERQTPTKKYLCNKMSCSHACERVSLFVCQCTCPAGMALASDKRTCKDKEYFGSVYHQNCSKSQEATPEVISTTSTTITSSLSSEASPVSESATQLPSHEETRASVNCRGETLNLVFNVIFIIIGFVICTLLFINTFQLKNKQSFNKLATDTDGLTNLCRNRADTNRPTELREMPNHYMEIPEHSRKSLL